MALVHAAPSSPSGGEGDDEAAALAGQRLDRRSRRRWPRRSPWRSPGRGPSRCRLPSPRRCRRARRSAPARSRGSRAPVDDPDHEPRPDQPRADQNRLAVAVADRVLEQVGEGALELGGSALSGGSSASSASRTASPPAPIESPGGLQQLGAGRPARGAARPCPVSSRETSSRFSTRRESRWPCSTTASLSSCALRGGDAGRVERGAGGDDRGQRRAQVVGDRAQQRRLQLVAAPQRLGLDHLRLHAVALPRERRQLGQRPVGLLASTLGLGGACPRQLGQGAARDRRRSRRREGDEVVIVGDGEAAHRREVEPVEGDALATAVNNPRPQSPEDRDQQDAREIDDAERDNRRHVFSG